MSPAPDLAPPGSSSYNSDTMSVGDGTWDSSRNDFLLPNLVGLNFDTMRYNGMGNRFRQLPGYHGLIRAHGVIAAITFLIIVPTAIMTIRFNHTYRDPRMGIRVHVWCQILTVLLTTVVFVLGWFAVGPSRKLTNPHHGIGLAIYVLVLFQFIFGWWMRSREKKKKRMFEPLKVMLHHWLGRAIALLGIAQIALGLTLYGSPLALFVLYALAVFALLVIYFILSHLRERDYGASDYDSRYSYGAGSAPDGRSDRRRRSGSGKLLKGALAGAGIYALVDRFRSKRQQRKGEDGPEVVGFRRHSGSYLEDEKYSQYGRETDRAARWEDRLMKIAAPIGSGWLVTRYFDRRYGDRDSDVGSYGPPLGGATSMNRPPLPAPGAPVAPGAPGAPFPPGAPGAPGVPLPPGMPSQPNPYNRPMPTGPYPPPQPLPSGQHPLNRPPSSMTGSSYLSAANEPRHGHGVRDGIATLGVLGLARSMFNRRKDRKDRRRLEDEQEARMSGAHYTGDGHAPRHHRRGHSSIGSNSSVTGQPHPQTTHGIPPIPAGTFPPGSIGAAQLERDRVAREERERRNREELPLGGIPRPVSMPPLPPDPQGIFHRDDESQSGSAASASAESREQHHSGRNAAAAGVAGGAAGLAAGEALANRRRGNSNSRGSGSLPPPPSNRTDPASPSPATAVSPPVSVKVHMRDNGRKVTLRRLPEEEARAERDARRAARLSRRRNAGMSAGSDSVSSLSASDMGGRPGHRFRRRDAQQQQQNDEAMRVESERLAEARQLAQQQQQQQQQQQPQQQLQPPPPPQHQNAPSPPIAGPSNFPPPPPIPNDSPRPPPGAGSSGVGGSGVGSPGTYDGGTSGGSDYAAQRRRRRAERAQGTQAKKTVGFEQS